MQNLNLLLDVCFLSLALLYIVRFLYFRANREAMLKKHKPGTHSHETLVKLMGTRNIIIAVGITLLLILKAAVDVRAILNNNNSGEGQVFLILSVGAVFMLATLAVVYYVVIRGGLRGR